jgi:hypothetical protein
VAETPKFTPKDLEWVKRQLAHPKPIYMVAELARLAGPNLSRRRLWRMLIRKGVIARRDNENRRVHIVPHSRLMATWPELWWSIRTAWEDILNVTSRRGAEGEDSP